MPEGDRGTCRDCHKPIKWGMTDGRWIPEDPATGARHRCQIERTCEGPGCGKAFKGASWMKLCPDCYRGQGGGRNRVQEPARRSQPKEPLQEDYDDDIPF
jgi:hypothetical protein